MFSLKLETAVIEKVCKIDVGMKVGKVQARPGESAKKDGFALSDRNNFARCQETGGKRFKLSFEMVSTCFQLNGGTRRSACNSSAGVKQAVSCWLAS
jgi:hypothetical protein